MGFKGDGPAVCPAVRADSNIFSGVALISTARAPISTVSETTRRCVTAPRVSAPTSLFARPFSLPATNPAFATEPFASVANAGVVADAGNGRAKGDIGTEADGSVANAGGVTDAGNGRAEINIWRVQLGL